MSPPFSIPETVSTVGSRKAMMPRHYIKTRRTRHMDDGLTKERLPKGLTV